MGLENILVGGLDFVDNINVNSTCNSETFRVVLKRLASTTRLRTHNVSDRSFVVNRDYPSTACGKRPGADVPTHAYAWRYQLFGRGWDVCSAPVTSTTVAGGNVKKQREKRWRQVRDTAPSRVITDVPSPPPPTAFDAAAARQRFTTKLGVISVRSSTSGRPVVFGPFFRSRAVASRPVGRPGVFRRSAYTSVRAAASRKVGRINDLVHQPARDALSVGEFFTSVRRFSRGQFAFVSTDGVQASSNPSSRRNCATLVYVAGPERAS